MAKTLIIPGLGGSGRGHWQDWWLRNDPNAVLVAQSNWRRPCPEAWTERLTEAVEAYPYSWLVAHSLGVPLVTRLAARRLDLRIAGALLVAPADVEKAEEAGPIRAFGPLSQAPLPFPATVVASRNDSWMPFRRARAFASAWRAQLVDYGHSGHINIAAGFGPWPDGPRFLSDIQRRQRRPTPVVRLWPSEVAGRAGTLV